MKTRFSIQMTISLATLCLMAIFSGYFASPAWPEGSVYTATFPNRARVADLKVCVPTEWTPGAKIYNVPAQGTITLPKKCEIIVTLRYDGLANMQSLQQLDASQVHRFAAAKLDFDDSHFQQLKKFDKMMSLNLDDTLISDKSLPLMGSFHDLTVIRVNGTDITGSGFDNLSKLHNLLSLNVSGIKLKAGALAKLKPATAHLIDLNLSRTGLVNSELSALADMKMLTALEMDGNKQLDNTCVKYLLPLKSLNKLDISDTAITDKSLPDLYKLPALKKVVIRNLQFWSPGKPAKVKAGLTFEDASGEAKMPIEMFSPLH